MFTYVSLKSRSLYLLYLYSDAIVFCEYCHLIIFNNFHFRFKNAITKLNLEIDLVISLFPNQGRLNIIVYQSLYERSPHSEIVTYITIFNR